MRTVSFKLPEELNEELNRLARDLGTSRSALVREAIESLANARQRSVVALAGDLVGSLDGPEDLATDRKHLAGYGR